MEELNFKTYKSGSAFKKNYMLHDLAEEAGKSLLIQWGVEFSEFGKDMRYEKVWENGKDKPDLIITYKNKSALIDWKGKHKPVWLVNKRALDAYLVWQDKLKLPILICFFVFNDENEILHVKFACPGLHKNRISEKKEWDKNKTIEFEQNIPNFTKPNLLKYL